MNKNSLRAIASRAEKNVKNPMGVFQTMPISFGQFPSENPLTFPELCQQTDNDEQGGLRFEIDKSRISIRLTAPYSEERRKHWSKLAKEGTNL